MGGGWQNSALVMEYLNAPYTSDLAILVTTNDTDRSGLCDVLPVVASHITCNHGAAAACFHVCTFLA